MGRKVTNLSLISSGNLIFLGNNMILRQKLAEVLESGFRSRRFLEGVGVGLLRVLRVGVGIFYLTPTPDVQFLCILNDVNRAAYAAARGSGVQFSNLFKRALPRIALHSVRLIKSLHLDFKQIVFCVMLCSGSRFNCFPFFNPMTGSKCQVHNQLLP